MVAFQFALYAPDERELRLCRGVKQRRPSARICRAVMLVVLLRRDLGFGCGDDDYILVAAGGAGFRRQRLYFSGDGNPAMCLWAIICRQARIRRGRRGRRRARRARVCHFRPLIVKSLGAFRSFR